MSCELKQARNLFKTLTKNETGTLYEENDLSKKLC